MLNFALGIRFLLELALLAAYGVWAWNKVDGGWRWLAVIAVPACVAVLWGVFLSPKAAIDIPAWAQFGMEAILFGGAAAALGSLGYLWIGIAGFAVWAVDKILVVTLSD